MPRNPGRLRLVPFALLALLGCEDNVQDPATWTPEILMISGPENLVDNSPDPYTLTVSVALPADAARAAQLSVELEISGSGLSSPDIWQLLDDGGSETPSAGLLQDAGGSGDVVPGDGVFTARGLADLAGALGVDFSQEAGSYSLTARLLEGSEVLVDATLTLDASNNSAPEILSVTVPDSLASGDSLHLSFLYTSEESDDELAGWLYLNGEAETRWPLQSQGDTLFSGHFGPEVGARAEGHSAYTLALEDGFNEAVLSPLSLFIENDEPAIPAGGLRAWQLVDGARLPLAISDSLRFVVPDPGETHTYFLDVRVEDPQGVRDVRAVTLDMSSLGLSDQPLRDDGMGADLVAGDGIYSMELVLDHAEEAPAPALLVAEAEPWLASQSLATLQQPTAFVPAIPNAAPLIEQIFLPDTLYAGEMLHVEAIFSDPDGAGNLASAWIRIEDTGDQWFLHIAGERWEADIPDMLAHFRPTDSYDFTIGVSDIFNEVTTQSVSLVIENALPVADEAQLIFYEIQDDGTGIPIEVADTVYFEIPAVGDSTVFVATLPVSDLEGADEIQRVQYINRPEGGGEFPFDLYDDGGSNAESADQEAGDGIYTAAFVLVGQESYNNYVYDWSFVATDIFGRESLPVDRVIRLVEEIPGSPPDGGNMRFTLPDRLPEVSRGR